VVPQSRDLADQLPALLIELWGRLGGVEPVSYNLTAWPGAPRRISVGSRLVRLGGYRTQDPLSIDLVGGAGGRVTTLLVVPVERATTKPRPHSPQAPTRAGRKHPLHSRVGRAIAEVRLGGPGMEGAAPAGALGPRG
jgi:hypothetical protein